MKLRIPYSWTTVAITFVFSCLLMGLRFSYGVFFKAFAAEFALNRAATSGIFSLYLLLSAVFALVNGWLLDRYGPRVLFTLMALFSGLCFLLTSQTNSLWQLFLSYSLLFAIGSGGTIPLIAAVVSRWFGKNRGLAIAISTGGSGLGMLIIPPVAGFLISAASWRLSSLIIGIAVVVILIPLALMLRKEPAAGIAYSAAGAHDKNEIESKPAHPGIPSDTLTIASALRNRNFWLLFIIWLMYATWVFTITTHIVPYATDSGIDLVQASTILSISGIVFIAARLLCGRIIDVVGIKMPSIIMAFVGTVCLLLLVWAREPWMFYVLAVGYGIGNGGLGVTILALPFSAMKSRNIGAIMGAMETSFTIGAAIGSYLGGAIFDISGSYAIAFFIGSACLLITVPLISVIRENK